MKNKLKLFIITFVAIAFSCCDEVEIHPISECNTILTPIEENPCEEIGLNPDVTTLSLDDAKIVASIYKNDYNRSRSTNDKIRNIVPIPGKDNKVALYAVNFSNGYIIIPASKKLPPILAEIDHGTFSLDDINTGRDILIHEMIELLECLNRNEKHPNFQQQWRVFSIPNNKITEPIKSREPVGTDAWLVQYELMYELQQQGYQTKAIRYFKEEQEDIPNSIYKRFLNDLNNIGDFWEDEEENLYNTAFIAWKDHKPSGGESFCIKSNWGQGAPYNRALEKTGYPLGCVTIAVGQLMKYHKYPSTFAWDSMPNILNSIDSDNTLPNFLARLHKELKVTDNGSSNMNNAEGVLKSYGYITEQKKHSLNNYDILPIICRGESQKTGVGHEWICDGERSYYYRTDYELYILDDAYYPNFKYWKYDEVIDQSTIRAFHMNWGWYGNDDGYYMDNSLVVSNGTDDFNTNRKDLIVRKP